MLLDEVAAEFVQHSPYATNSYLKGGSFANSVLHARRKVCIQVATSRYATRALSHCKFAHRHIWLSRNGSG